VISVAKLLWAVAALGVYALFIGWGILDAWREITPSRVDGERIKGVVTAIAAYLNIMGAAALGATLPEEPAIVAAGADADSRLRRITTRIGRLITSKDRDAGDVQISARPAWLSTATAFATAAFIIWTLGTAGSLFVWLVKSGEDPELVKAAAAIGVAILPQVLKAAKSKD